MSDPIQSPPPPAAPPAAQPPAPASAPAPTPDPAPQPPAKEPSELDALKAQIAELQAKTAAAEAAADEARRAKLTDQERLAEDRKRLDDERAALQAQRRDAVLDRLGVLPKVRQLAPVGDPSNPSYMADLEQWARNNPEFVRQPAKPAEPPPVPAKSNLAKVLAGEVSNRFAKMAFDRLTREG